MTGSIRLLVLREIRARWRGSLVLIALLALLGGAALTAAAGARRTDTALSRFTTATNSAGYNVSPVFPGFDRLPAVASADELVGEPLFRVLPGGRVDPRFPLPVGSSGDQLLYHDYGLVIRSGRLPNPSRADEAIASVTAADSDHLTVGSVLTLRDLKGIVTRAHLAAPTSLAPTTGAHVHLKIVGIGVGLDDIAAASARSQGGAGAFGTIYLSPAYVRDHGGPQDAVYTGALIRIRPGATVVQLRRQLAALAAQHPDVSSGSNYDMSDIAVSSAAIQRAVRPDVVALWLFSVLVGLAVLLMIGQVLARRAWTSAADFSTLRALGLTRSQFVIAITVPTTAIAALGALLAAAVAVAASPLTPVGPARIAEPNGGVAVNVAILAAGVALVVVWLATHVAFAAWRGSRALTRSGEAETSRLAGGAAAAHLSAPASVGLRWALVSGRGPAAVPLRSTIVGASLAIVTLVVAVTFNVALGRLSATPPLYGWNWDVAIDGGYVPLPTHPVVAALSRVHGVAGWAGGNYGSVVIKGRLVPAIGLDSLHGTVIPSLLNGSQPRGPTQIALGTITMREVGARTGGSVGTQVAGVERRLRVTGEVVLPDFERGGFAATDLGVGAVTSSEIIHPTGIPPRATYNFFLVRYAPRASPIRVQAAVETALAPICAHGSCSEFIDRRPHEVNAYGQIAWTPLLLSVLLGVLAAGMLAHALVTSVHRRRHDIGILKTLGFTRSQVSATVTWQATALMLEVLAVGLPLGVVAGRWIWVLFANQLGVTAASPVPWVFLVSVVPVALLVGALVAAVPAWSARSTKALTTLRAE